MNSALIIDDNETCLTVGKLHLENLGYTPVEARNLDEAVELIKDIGFDLIIIDIHIPLKSGLEICKEIKNQLQTPPPCIAISTDDEIVNGINFQEHGFSSYIQKPLTQTKLKEAINEALAY